MSDCQGVKNQTAITHIKKREGPFIILKKGKQGKSKKTDQIKARTKMVKISQPKGANKMSL